MNTADRSLAMVDYALRRRFAFVTLKPCFDSPKLLARLVSTGLHQDHASGLLDEMVRLNESIQNDKNGLGPGYCIGHSYFCPPESGLSKHWIDAVLESEILPLLEEYWMDNPGKAQESVDALKKHLA